MEDGGKGVRKIDKRKGGRERRKQEEKEMEKRMRAKKERGRREENFVPVRPKEV